MAKVMKRKVRKGRLAAFVILFFMTAFCLAYGTKLVVDNLYVDLQTGYYANNQNGISLYDSEFNIVEYVARGEEVKYVKNDFIEKENVKYYKINDKDLYVLESNIVKNHEDVVLEEAMYVRTPVTVYKDNTGSDILSFIKKGEMVSIIGFDKLDKGSVNKYKIKYNDIEGYVYAKYLLDNEEKALENYDNGSYYKHVLRTNYYDKTENAGALDYFPYDKPKFSSNIMPEDVRSLYLNAESVSNVDEYITIAKESGINAFVVDIKDGQLAYVSEVAKTYSPNGGGRNSVEVYKTAIKKLKDNGFYVIGRICAFNDSAFAGSNKDEALTKNGSLYVYSGMYWPTPYSRVMWQYNVELAKEAVNLFGFNEIQYDYVRFTDNAYVFGDVVDVKNKYNETKSQVIQNFLFYACDQLHELNVYVSADVFGESANGTNSSTSTSGYITGYGQYWPAISNVVDVISAMPYPDHFNAHEYGIEEIVWTVPYKLLKTWGSVAMARQAEATTPAIARTWIQAYDTIREPFLTYGPTMVSEQLRALYEVGLDGGFMTWCSYSGPAKYRSLKDAFLKEYK